MSRIVLPSRQRGFILPSMLGIGRGSGSAAAGHRYWRIRAAQTYGGESNITFSLAEVQLRDSIGGADLTGSGTASASNTLGGYPPSNAFDNNASTFWTSFGGIKQTGGDWIAYDFGSGNAYDIVEISMTVRPDGFREDPTRVYVEWSDDGSAWTVGWSVQSISAWTAGETRTFDSTSAAQVGKCWRIRSSSTSAGGFFGVAELQMRSTSGGSDLTTGKVAASSVFLGGYEPEKAIDDNASTFWTTGAAGAPTGGHWLSVIDISPNIVEVVITVRPDGFREDPLNLFVESTESELTWDTYWSVPTIAAWSAGETRTFTM